MANCLTEFSRVWAYNPCLNAFGDNPVRVLVLLLEFNQIGKSCCCGPRAGTEGNAATGKAVRSTVSF
jgi:hypothetical protein